MPAEGALVRVDASTCMSDEECAFPNKASQIRLAWSSGDLSVLTFSSPIINPCLPVVARSGEGLDPQIFHPHRHPDGGRSPSPSASSGYSVETGSCGSRLCAQVAIDLLFLIRGGTTLRSKPLPRTTLRRPGASLSPRLHGLEPPACIYLKGSYTRENAHLTSNLRASAALRRLQSLTKGEGRVRRRREPPAA